MLSHREESTVPRILEKLGYPKSAEALQGDMPVEEWLWILHEESMGNGGLHDLFMGLAKMTTGRVLQNAGILSIVVEIGDLPTELYRKLEDTL